MASASIQTRSKQKLIARVDVGAFGYPMRFHAWLRKRNATIVGKIGVAVAKAAIGLVLFVTACALMGAPLNPLTMLFAIGFAIGSAMGGPFSFLLWSIAFLEITGLASGLTVGAWVNSPSWWRTLAADWRNGSAIPTWFVIAIPVWMFVWIAAGRGIAKAADMLFDKLALMVSFKAARRFMSADEKLRRQAIAEAQLSEDEARRTLHVIEEDGTRGVFLGEKPKMNPTQQEEQDAAASYRDFLGGGEGAEQDEAVLNAASGAKFKESMLGAGDDAPVSVSMATPEAAKSAEKSAFLQTPSLPAVPAFEEPPVQKTRSPNLDARASRAMNRHMKQLVDAFEHDKSVDEMASFVARHQNTLLNLSEDQQRTLDTIASGPEIIEISRQLRQENAAAIRVRSSFAKPAIDMSLLTGEPLASPPPGISLGVEEAEGAVEPTQTEAPPVAADVSEPQVSDRNPNRDLSHGAREMADILNSVMTPSSGSAPQREPSSDKPSYDDLESAGSMPGERATADCSAKADAQASDMKFDVDPEAMADAPSKSKGGTAAGAPVEEDTNLETSDAAGPDGATEKKMVAYKKDEVLLVCGLLAAQVSPQDKAKNVLAFQEEHPNLVVAEVINSRSFSEVVGDQGAAQVRHSWREVQALISAPPVERLSREFDRLNDKGRRLIDEPHTLNQAEFNHWTQESWKLRSQMATSEELLKGLSEPMKINVGLAETMSDILAMRATAARDGVTRIAGIPLSRQKVDSREKAERGRSVLSNIMAEGKGDARGPHWPLAGGRQATAVAVDPAAEEHLHADNDIELAAGAAQVKDVAEQGQEDVSTNDVQALQPGEEGFVSQAPEGSPEYRREMATHEALLAVNRDIAEEAERLKKDELEKEEALRAAQSKEDAESVARIRAGREAAAQTENDAKVKAAKLAVETAEAERNKAANDARASEALAREAQVSLENAELIKSRSALENMVLSASQKINAGLFQLPVRFQQPDIIEAVMAFEEVISYKPRLVSKSSARLAGEVEQVSQDVIVRTRSSSLQRSIVQFEQLAGDAAMQVLGRIAQLIDAPEASPASIILMLDDAAEKMFAQRFVNAAETGESAAGILKLVAEVDADRERLADGAASMDDLHKSLEQHKKRVSDLAEEKQTWEAGLEELRGQLSDANEEIANLKRQLTGEIDDDFQKILDEKMVKMEDAGIPGVYQHRKSDGSAVIIVLTAKASTFPDGMANLAGVDMPITDVVEWIIRTAAGPSQRGIKHVLYVDPHMRPHLSAIGGTGVALKQCSRDARELSDFIGEAK